MDRLILLNRATQAGHPIGQIAQMDREELEKLTNGVAGTRNSPTALGLPHDSYKQLIREQNPRVFIEHAATAAAALNVQGIWDVLLQAQVAFSLPVVLDTIVGGLSAEIGNRVRQGELRLAHERAVQSVLEAFLMLLCVSQDQSDAAPRLVVGSMVGLHDPVPALGMAAAATAEGWRVHYLGHDLPAQEIASAAIQCDASVIVICVPRVGYDPLVQSECRKLARFIPQGTRVLVAGTSPSEAAALFGETHALSVPDTTALRSSLAGVGNVKAASNGADVSPGA